MAKYSNAFTPPTQREPANNRQIKNSAGGYVYKVEGKERFIRFLILGSEGGSFYASEKDLTKQNVDQVRQFARTNPWEYWFTLREINDENRAPRHSTLLLALAILLRETDDPATRQAMRYNFTEIVRTGAHLFEFVEYALSMGGWGRGLRSLVASWYTSQGSEDLAYQIVKYRARDGYTHDRLIRTSHPKGYNDDRSIEVIKYALNGYNKDSNVPQVVHQFESVKTGDLDVKHTDALTWEMLPTSSLTDPETWEHLLTKNRLPYTAMLRNLGRMTSHGVFDTNLDSLRLVVNRLTSKERVRGARIHPFNILTAMKTYSAGHGFRGSMTWTPSRAILDALDEAFWLAFGNIEENDSQRTCVALDVSGSMVAPIMGSNITAMEGSVAMAMATIAAAPHTTDVIAFSSGYGEYGYGAPWIRMLETSHRRRLDDNLREVRDTPFGRTDCALPMIWAAEQKRIYDTFVIYTDNETWYGSIHPMEALQRYRKQFNPDAKLIVVGMVSNGFSIADPQDPGSLDVVGFDAATPNLIQDFTAGRFKLR